MKKIIYIIISLLLFINCNKSKSDMIIEESNLQIEKSCKILELRIIDIEAEFEKNLCKRPEQTNTWFKLFIEIDKKTDSLLNFISLYENEINNNFENGNKKYNLKKEDILLIESRLKDYIDYCLSFLPDTVTHETIECLTNIFNDKTNSVKFSNYLSENKAINLLNTFKIFKIKILQSQSFVSVYLKGQTEQGFFFNKISVVKLKKKNFFILFLGTNLINNLNYIIGNDTFSQIDYWYNPKVIYEKEITEQPGNYKINGFLDVPKVCTMDSIRKNFTIEYSVN